MIAVCKAGKNPTMRHMGRTHGVNLTSLCNDIKVGRLILEYIVTDEMAADIFTKAFPEGSREKWLKALKMLGFNTG